MLLSYSWIVFLNVWLLVSVYSDIADNNMANIIRNTMNNPDRLLLRSSALTILTYRVIINFMMFIRVIFDVYNDE